MKKKKIDKRVAYHIVLDVETANGLDNPLIYDIGYAITDRRGKIYETRSFIIKEIWENKSLMSGAYYSNKIPQYKRDIDEGKRKVVTFLEMRNDMLQLMKEYNVKYLGAYNLAFDMKALGNTIKYVTNKEVKFLTKRFSNIQLNCIWSLACQVLYVQKGYSKFCLDNHFVSQAGNYQTSAEVGYAYIKNNPNFREEHTGLEDVLIEIEIMAHALKQNKKHKKGIDTKCWKIPQD